MQRGEDPAIELGYVVFVFGDKEKAVDVILAVGRLGEVVDTVTVDHREVGPLSFLMSKSCDRSILLSDLVH